MKSENISDTDFRNQPEKKQEANETQQTQECEHEWFYTGERRYNHYICEQEYREECLRCGIVRWV